jgi:hypothetical protein
MKWIEDIKQRLGRITLNNQLKGLRLHRKTSHFSEASYIGILYDASDDEHAKLVQDYGAQLKSQGKKVFLLGFVNEKELPFKYKFLAYTEYFWLKNLNWNYLPTTESVGRFMNEEFDFLLNLYTTRPLWLEAISGLSHAGLRVGKYHPDSKLYFDLMIDTGSNNDLKNYIQQVDRYIKSV